MHALFRQRVTDALPEPAVTARHQCNRPSEVHEFSPMRGCAVVSRRLPVSGGSLLPKLRRMQAIGREGQAEFPKSLGGIFLCDINKLRQRRIAVSGFRT